MRRFLTTVLAAGMLTTSSGVFSGTISGNDLTIILDGVTWVYSK